MIGPGGQLWDDVVRAATLVVATWARDGQFHYYTDLARAVNEELPEAALEPHGFAMNRLLYDVVLKARGFEPDGPMLSAVVVLKTPTTDSPVPDSGSSGKSSAATAAAGKKVTVQASGGEEFAACTKLWTRSRVRQLERWLRS